MDEQRVTGLARRGVAEAERDPERAAAGPAALRGVDLVWLGRQVRALREARGVSQVELARRTGSPRTYLIALEQGRHEPALEVIGRIAAALQYEARLFVWYLAGEPFADPAAPLAARVRLRRERLGLRPAELAARAGTTRATISQIERGVNANPSLGLLVRLAAALQCCPSELVPEPRHEPCPD
jgi:transcriptional regulator with XRE-family HTH domain